MHGWQSQSHVRWERKYHVVIIPKHRRKVFNGSRGIRSGPVGFFQTTAPNGGYLT